MVYPQVFVVFLLIFLGGLGGGKDRPIDRRQTGLQAVSAVGEINAQVAFGWVGNPLRCHQTWGNPGTSHGDVPLRCLITGGWKTNLGVG
jgi:hypothetical protein